MANRCPASSLPRPPGALHDLAGCFANDVPPGARRIAWDAISFCVPSNWELAVYRFLRRGVTRIELEDEYSVRVEAEWVRGRKGLHLQRIMKRYETASKPLTLKSEERNPVEHLPAGWHATHFVFKETATDEQNPDLHVTRHELVTAFYLCPHASVFCFFLLHFLPDDTEDAVATVQQLAHSFQDHGEDATVPWQLFDIGFTVPRAFTLEQTQFDIGTKLMVFEWKRRRFYLWHFSCADVLAREGGTLAKWACGYLNGFGGMKAPVFMPDGGGGLAWRRRRPYLFGHRVEIARQCFRYSIGLRHLEPGNQLVVWVFHYRRDADLAMLPD